MRTLLLVLALTAGLEAQGYTRIAWTAPGYLATAADAQAVAYRVRDNGGAAVALSSVSCAAVAWGIDCVAPLPPAMAAVLAGSGAHAVTVSAMRNGVEEISLAFSVTNPGTCVDGTAQRPVGFEVWERVTSTSGGQSTIASYESRGWRYVGVDRRIPSTPAIRFVCGG